MSWLLDKLSKRLLLLEWFQQAKACQNSALKTLNQSEEFA